MKATAPPTITNSRIRPRVAMRAGILMKRADVWRADGISGRRRPLGARASSCRKQANTSVSVGSDVVGRRLLLVVDHQQPLGLEAEPRGDVADRLLDVLLRRVLAAVVRVAWPAGRTRRRRCRARPGWPPPSAGRGPVRSSAGSGGSASAAAATRPGHRSRPAESSAGSTPEPLLWSLVLLSGRPQPSAILSKSSNSPA